jgi:malonyl-CoA O-methyltransferase
MNLIAKVMNRNRAVARRFGARAADYDAHAGLQRDVAGKLASLFPDLRQPSVLEIGCGTGFLTQHLVQACPGGEFLITDIAPEMVARCRATLGERGDSSLSFAVMDGEAPDRSGPFDLIASSMTLQWFGDPLKGLERLNRLLRPGGTLAYATLGPGGFPQWREVLAAEGLPAGVVSMPELPGVVREEDVNIRYGTGRDFLAAMRAIGASEPRAGYRPLVPGRLRRALRRLEEDHNAEITWQFVYGLIRA